MAISKLRKPIRVSIRKRERWLVVIGGVDKHGKEFTIKLYPYDKIDGESTMFKPNCKVIEAYD